MSEMCSRCGSPKIIPSVSIRDFYGDSAGNSQNLQVRVDGKPGALLFTDSAFAELRARVCCACGHTELFAEGFEKLYEKHLKATGGRG